MSGYRRIADDDDDGPSADDLARFGHDRGYCPVCGAEVWDDATNCPACGNWFQAALNRPPAERQARRAVGIVLLALAAASFLLLAMCTL